MRRHDFFESYALMCSQVSKPIRLQIIHAIANDSVCVTDLQKKVDITMSSLSNHLSALYRSGVLRREKKGNYAYYSLAEPELIQAIEHMSTVFKSIIKNRDSAGF